MGEGAWGQRPGTASSHRGVTARSHRQCCRCRAAVAVAFAVLHRSGVSLCTRALEVMQYISIRGKWVAVGRDVANRQAGTCVKERQQRRPTVARTCGVMDSGLSLFICRNFLVCLTERARPSVVAGQGMIKPCSGPLCGWWPMPISSRDCMCLIETGERAWNSSST